VRKIELSVVAAGLLALMCATAGPATAQWPLPQACANADGSYATDDCLNAQLADADKALNAAYKQAETQIAAAKVDEAARAAWLGELVKAQRAWLAYRDANCAFNLIGAEWNFGSGTNAAVPQCLLALTQQRTAELLARYPVQ
jgi:uncharacterized protein YecT (DUF1311 family)